MDNKYGTPLISVIISVYNAEKYLMDCVASVCAQSYERLEIILVEDGASDDSPRLCDLLAERDSRVVVVHRENGGVSSARNAGLELAHGDYVAFVDCDDRLEPEMYESLLRLLIENDADIASSTFYEQRPDGSVRQEDDGEITVFSGLEAMATMLGNIEGRTTYRMMVWFFVWNKLYKRSLLRDIRFDPNTDSAEDVPFNLRAFELADRVVLIRRPFYFWRSSAGSLSNRHSVKALSGGACTGMVMYRYASAMPEIFIRAAVTSAFRNMYWYYSFCVAEAHTARKEGKGDERGEYLALRDRIRDMLRQMRAEPAYRKLTKAYKLAVFLMTEMPGMFSALWLSYRFLRCLRK